MRKMYCVGHSGGYHNWMECELTKDMEEASAVIFTGGEDVSPQLYNKRKHETTASNLARDISELKAFNLAKKLGKPMIGICRGSQFLCVANGGILVQHQENNDFYHPIKTEDGKEIIVSSTHHQSARPFNLPESDYRVIGWTEGLNGVRYGEDWQDIIDESEKECEIVFYPKTRSLGIQSHPEMCFREKMEPRFQEYIDYCRNLLNKLINNTL